MLVWESLSKRLWRHRYQLLHLIRLVEPEAIIHDETGIIVPLMEDGENNLEDFENAILELSQNKSKMEYLQKNSLKRAKEIFSKRKH